MRLGLVVALAISGCGKSPTVDNPTTNGSASMNKPMKPGPTHVFAPGAPLQPQDKLLAFLDGAKRDGEPRLLRLPVVLARGQVGFDISKATIGTGGLQVVLDDSALGVGLGERADQKCGDAETCAFLVEGYWKGKQMMGYELAVNKAEPLAADALAAISNVEVEGETAN